MPVHDFFFALVLSRADQYEMLADVLKTVLGHAGLAPDAIAELSHAVRGAAPSGAAQNQPCRIAFRADSGDLHVDVTRAGAADWHTARRLP